MTYDGSMPQINDSELPQYGENIARTLNATGRIRGIHLAKELIKNIHNLHQRHSSLEAKYPDGEAVPPYIEWLLDNFYLAQREGLQSAAELRSCGRLPAANGTAALFSLCLALIRSGDGKVTPERSRLFLHGCQQVYVLSRRELLLFVPTLKAAAIAELGDLYCSGIDGDYAARAAEKLFTTLRALSTLDFSEFLESVDKTEQILKRDPAEVYPSMSEKTRNHYKRRVEKLAKAYHVSEYRIAEHVLGLAQASDGAARHVGYWLFTRPMDENKVSHSGEIYISLNLLITLALSLTLAFAEKSVLLGLLLLLPISELVKSIIDYILLSFTRPAHIPRMELENGVPPLGRTICVISALITNEHCGAALARRLEEFRLANRSCGENLLFGILADLPDAKSKDTPEDQKRIAAVKQAVDELNQKYGGGFFFFIRERSFNKADKCYSAWERKRGAITELAQLLCEKDSSLQAISGNYLSLRGVRYIMTLDEDTRLTPGTAKELIGAMLHPLNTPVIDEHTKIVVTGHAVIHPRISVELSSCNRSRFSKIFAGHGGTDPYGSDSSELYMDVFENGGFAGKGIIDVEAFTKCLQNRIPINRVLSHDALEGAFLNGGFMGDAELTDKFPADILSYYRRLHRWTRGDWQNLPWLFGRGKALSDIDHFRLFDSIRRSLVAPLTFIVFLAAFFSPSRGLTVAALIALLSFTLHLVFIAIRDLFRDEREVRIRCHSAIVHGVGGAFIQTALKLAFLPYEAYICATAAVAALWRMLVTHSGLLRWTPVSVFEGKAQGAKKYIRNMWFAPLAAIIILLFSPSIIGKASAVIWLFSPLYAFSLSKTITRQIPLSVEDRSYLLAFAKKIWSFFEDFCTAEDNYLPPDNWQERPPIGIAHRTSPTNIGLCLLSCLSAIDLNITRPQAALGIIQNILTTLRRMQKWNGHLYNWYDTRTLKPLHPAYVSTVDSGNLAACLIILREALLEYDRADLASSCDELLLPMSFVPMYDKAHHLFSIGIDADRDFITNSFYDLMASEARTTGFIAIARGDVSRRHWRSLSRAQVEKDGYRGMVSWTGSMFEYLMPRLFFESAEGSLMYESIRFAVEVQKKRGKSKHLPWGISESAFYALDPSLNYRYKAHGCGALALKRNMNSEFVVSPYSSFLALCCGAKAVVSNLRKLERLDSAGKYGFWEAVDFTDERTIGNNGEVVYCVMAHHLGMSLVAIANALCGNIMPHRLMRDPAMSAHACLLDEKLPLGGVLLRRKENKLPEKPPRTRNIYWEKRGDFVDFESPICCLLSNSEYSVMLTDGGVSKARCKELMPYYTPNDFPAFAHGVELFLKRDNEIISLLPSATAVSSAKINWEFSFSGAKIDTEAENLRAQVLFSVSDSSNGEKRVISVSPSSGEEQSCELCVMFEPALAPYCDYVNHPAFYKLGLHAKMHHGTLIIKRVKRESIPESYLCFAASMPMEVSARRALVPGRGGLKTAIENYVPSPLGWLNDPMICAKIPLRLAMGIESAVTLALAVGDSEEEAFAFASRILAGGNSDLADFPAERASKLRLSETEALEAMELMNAISYPAPFEADSIVAKNELWRFGISGNLPLVTQAINLEEDLETAETLMKQHAFLKSLYCPFDLVFLTDEGGDYMRPASNALTELKLSAGCDNPSIHIIDRSSNADCLVNLSVKAHHRGLVAKNRDYIMSTTNYLPKQDYPQYDWDSDGCFIFYVNHSLPPRAWGNILTNGRFGFFATDCGTGHMWYKNARECRINRWLCDSVTTHGTEAIQINHTSLFAAPEDTDCKVSFGLGYAKWEKELDGRKISMTAFVPADTDARVLLIEWEGGGTLPLRWSTDLVLCGDDSSSTRVKIEKSGDCFSASSPENPFPDSVFRICSSEKAKGFTSDRALWLQEKTDDKFQSGGFIGISFVASSPFILVCGCDDEDKLRELCSFDLALESYKSTARSWQNTVSAVKIKTPLPSLDRLINFWLPYQAIACRMLGRCSIYQSGGATGFRDQLQDAVNVLLLDSAPAKAQILDCCKHQYEQGDVMHWWHTLDSDAKGVRTHCSDDLIWLPWALSEYTEKTGDLSICALTVPWLCSPPLGIDERDRYEKAVYTETSDEVIIHAQKALDKVLERGTGAHGLLKMGNGDWNDGMDKVGVRGRGESVWLTWFFSHTAHRFAALLTALGQTEQAQKYEAAAAELGKSANEAWDGKWYLRGYYDKGTPLGSKAQPFCQIDSIAQSFSSLSPEAEKNRVNEALSSAVSKLFDKENRIIRLFDPPFENSDPSPGYIESYGPGFRENGGQYTHGAVWLAMALLRENRTDEALELIEALLPDNRNLSNYEAEPYVLAADISSNPDCHGKAGWSWYTGSAGWFYRTVTEDLLGINLENGEISVTPKLPSGWSGCEITLRDKNGLEQSFTFGETDSENEENS
ncbi:MAG: hypothetical protein KBI01_06655 [Oscillospiraceae bacterium]|nr:hypothetical protein [Oscillospiraceae bacterium]